MSIAVPLDELADRLIDFPWAYLVTVRDDGRSHALAVPTRLVNARLMADGSRAACTNASQRPQVTMLFPGPHGNDMSLIVDGNAEVEGDHIWITPTWAVLHRPALTR